MKKVGILGSGGVAKALGEGFLKHGFQVKLGTRDHSKLREWLSGKGESASVGSFEEAAHYGELLVLAVKGKFSADVLTSAGRANLQGNH